MWECITPTSFFMTYKTYWSYLPYKTYVSLSLIVISYGFEVFLNHLL